MKSATCRPVCTEGRRLAKDVNTGGLQGPMPCGGDWNLKWLERHPCFLSYVDQYTCTMPPNQTIVCWGNDDYETFRHGGHHRVSACDVYLYTYIHTYIHKNIQARRPSSCVGLCILVTYNKYVCMYVCMYVCITYIYIHTHMYIYVHI